MCYNAVFDIPALLLIQVSCGVYAFRALYRRAFTLFLFFLVYYINLTVVLKLAYAVLTQIDYVQNFFKEN